MRSSGSENEERARVQAVESLEVMDSPPDELTDNLVALAAGICQVPIAVIGLIDADRQWFKAACGVVGSQVPRHATYCTRVIAQHALLEVEDALADPAYATNPSVQAELGIRFYAGVPLIGRAGHAYGTLCVADTRPRRLDDLQRQALRGLAQQAVLLLESHRERREAVRARHALAHLLDAIPDAIIACDAQGRLRELNGAARAWFDADATDVAIEAWPAHLGLFSPDGARVLEPDAFALVRALDGETVRDAEMLIRGSGGHVRRVSCNARRVSAPDGASAGAVCVLRDVTELHEARTRLKDNEHRLRAVLRNSHDAFVAIDESGDVVEWNPAAEALFGWPSDDALGQPMVELIVPPAHRRAHAEGMQRYLTTRTSHVLNKRIQLAARHRSGSEFPVEMTISTVALEHGQLFTAFLHDISKRVATESQLRESESRLRSITDNAPALIAYVDCLGLIQFANRAVSEWFGEDANGLVGAPADALTGRSNVGSLDGFIERALGGEQVVTEVEVKHASGETRHVEFVAIPDAGTDGATRGCHVMGFDVSDRRELARVYAEQALRDALTGLPNRAAWEDELQRGLARCQRNGSAAVVMFINLDGFKSVNDTHGHAAGDAVLRTFAERLRTCLRSSDLVARLAGDEFVVLLDHVVDPDRDPLIIARKILEAASSGAKFQGRRLPIRPSIGVGVQRGPKHDAEALMRCADEAMYIAKNAKGSGVHMKTCSGATCRTFVLPAVP